MNVWNNLHFYHTYYKYIPDNYDNFNYVLQKELKYLEMIYCYINDFTDLYLSSGVFRFRKISLHHNIVNRKIENCNGECVIEETTRQIKQKTAEGHEWVVNTARISRTEHGLQLPTKQNVYMFSKNGRHTKHQNNNPKLRSIM